MTSMKPEIAQRRIDSFAKRFGKEHLILAYHGAFPLALTPDLLYKLWANFQRDINDNVLGIPWVAVADLLLSSLCEEVGYELYEMDRTVRNILLKQLKETVNFGPTRINELASFLLTYIKNQIKSDDPDVRDFATAQRWIALAYVNPNQAALELRDALEKVQQQGKSEQVRLNSLLETLSEALTKFKPLLTYAGKNKLNTVIIISLDDQYEKEFVVKLTVKKNGEITKQIYGSLPINPLILKYYRGFLGSTFSDDQDLSTSDGDRSVSTQNTNFSVEDLPFLSASLNDWLNCDSFRPIKDELITELSRIEKARIILETDNYLLYLVPWHLWDLLNLYPQTEIAISPSNYPLYPIVNRTYRETKNELTKVRILAIFAQSSEKVTQETQLLQKLPRSKTAILHQPSYEDLDHYLQDEEGWDMVYFSDHGNERHSNISYKDIGVEIGILNVSDGISLATQLCNLGLHQIITMKEKVSPTIAGEFLKYFFEAFTGGKSLYSSVQQTRQELKKFERSHPGASSLPVIVQNPNTIPPTWNDLLSPRRL